LLSALAVAQSPTATISGIVLDPSGRIIVHADVLIVNDSTGIRYQTATNEEGVYAIPNLAPGSYHLQVSKAGFKTVIKPDIVLNVRDALAMNFTLPIGAVSEAVTVQAGAPLLKTEGSSVGTVIDRQFVENLPLNGRSFNTLLQLTPGVVIAKTNSGSPGQYSISGQRTDANDFLVDGVSANFGVSPTLSLQGSGAGSAQAFSAFGGTSSLVSVEALQEFRVETSSFAPEFGRTPGGQVILSTRSGSNNVHGGVYDYFRNDVLDANDWFANAAHKPKPAERHNDFGGFLGGPILRNRAFFFFSYEGARLRTPQTSVIQVPSMGARSSAPSQLAPFLNAYPVPNGAVSANGSTAQFTGSFSNRATLDATSLRIDHELTDSLLLFGRYSYAPSETVSRINNLSDLSTVNNKTRTLTVGLNLLHGGMGNAFRANYSSQDAHLSFALDNFGGAAPVSPSLFLGTLPGSENGLLFATFDTGFYFLGPNARNRARQLNFVDDLSFSTGYHQLKVGADYRAIRIGENPFQHQLQFLASSVPALLSTGSATVSAGTAAHTEVLSQALSLYAQDNWRVTARLILTYGLRWELSPAPSAGEGTSLGSWTNLNNPSAFTLAPEGTPLWSTTYGNFAPRIGIAYSLTGKNDLVLRAGAGLFYDLGVGSATDVLNTFPNVATKVSGSVSLPVTDATTLVPTLSRQPPYPGVEAFASDLQLPRSYQWNVALERSITDSQAISATYVGQVGRRLLRRQDYFRPNPNFTSYFLITDNSASSNYNALQLQYRRPLSSRLQALLNYSWSHSIDNASSDAFDVASDTVVSSQNDRASSDFDVRHSFSAALTFVAPGIGRHGVAAALTRNWSVAPVVVARSGFPFNASLLSVTVGNARLRPDRVAGAPAWISSPAAPGGKMLNPNAFSIPGTVRQGTEGRNDITGFGLTQVDLSVFRKFAVKEPARLEVRMDAFNLFNHPNFVNPRAFIGAGTRFLQSSQMLNQALGGLNPLFQQGGPRSLQLSMRLTF
jgi:hypothetical protein